MNCISNRPGWHTRDRGEYVWIVQRWLDVRWLEMRPLLPKSDLAAQFNRMTQVLYGVLAQPPTFEGESLGPSPIGDPQPESAILQS